MTQKATKNNRNTLVLTILLVCGLIVIIIAQYLMIKVPIDNNRLPSPWYLLNFAGMGFIVIGILLRTRVLRETAGGGSSRFHPVYWIGTSIFLIGLTVFSLLYFLKKDYQNYDFVTICWFLAGAFYVFAFSQSFPHLSQIRLWLKVNRNELS